VEDLLRNAAISVAEAAFAYLIYSTKLKLRHTDGLLIHTILAAGAFQVEKR
jgi:hypothetical protein